VTESLTQAPAATIHPGRWRAIAWGGLAAGIGDSVLALFLHFFIATTAAAVYVSASRALPLLARQPVPCGLAFGIGVYFFMKYVVLPLSAVTRRTPFDPAAMIGHALLVGLPIALFARR